MEIPQYRKTAIIETLLCLHVRLFRKESCYCIIIDLFKKNIRNRVSTVILLRLLKRIKANRIRRIRRTDILYGVKVQWYTRRRFYQDSLIVRSRHEMYPTATGSKFALGWFKFIMGVEWA